MAESVVASAVVAVWAVAVVWAAEVVWALAVVWAAQVLVPTLALTDYPTISRIAKENRAVSAPAAVDKAQNRTLEESGAQAAATTSRYQV